MKLMNIILIHQIINWPLLTNNNLSKVYQFNYILNYYFYSKKDKSTENKFRSDEFTSTNKTSELLRQFADNYSEDFEVISENENSN